MLTKILSIFVTCILMGSSGCAVQMKSTSTPANPLESGTSVPPVLKPVKLITVLAAASLTEPFNEIGRLFEQQNPGTRVVFSSAGSQQLVQQLTEGAPGDVFASANYQYMEDAVASNRVAQGSASVFAHNRLVVIFPKNNPARISSLQDLATPGIKLDLADKVVPVGRYSLDFLDIASKDIQFPPGFAEDVLKNVVSYEENVKAVLTKVTLGEVDAGIVYTSDIAGRAAGQVGSLAIPDALNVIAVYPIAPISDSANPALAKAFIDLVLSKTGQDILAKYGITKG